MDTLYTLKELSDKLGMTRQWLLIQIQRGILPAVKKGTVWLVQESDLGKLDNRNKFRGRPGKRSVK